MRPKGLAGGKNVMAHQSRPEEITMKETFSAGAGGGILRPSLLNRHEDFGIAITRTFYLLISLELRYSCNWAWMTSICLQGKIPPIPQQTTRNSIL